MEINAKPEVYRALKRDKWKKKFHEEIRKIFGDDLIESVRRPKK